MDMLQLSHETLPGARTILDVCLLCFDTISYRTKNSEGLQQMAKKQASREPDVADVHVVTPEHQPIFRELLEDMVLEPGEEAGCMACGKKIEVECDVCEIVIIRPWDRAQPATQGGLCRDCAALPDEAKVDKLIMRGNAALKGRHLRYGRA